MNPLKFSDRAAAGVMLAKKLLKYKKYNPVVLALPRGGVPIGYEVAKKLDSVLDVFIVRKIGAPNNPEYGIGAVSEEGVIYMDNSAIINLDLSFNLVSEKINKEKIEIQRRVKLYRKGKPLPGIKGKTVIIVDDGLATGVTARCAIKAVRQKIAKKIIFAAPVCAAETSRILEQEISLFCHLKPQNLRAIGEYYQDFNQVTDEEVIDMIKAISAKNSYSSV